MEKVFFSGCLCALFFMGSACSTLALAAESEAMQQQAKQLPVSEISKKLPELAEKKLPPMLSRRPQLSKTEAAAKLQANYGYRYSEMLHLLDIGHSYNELNQACLYAYLADVPVEKVLQLRQPTTWGRVRVQLGLTPKAYAEKYMQYQVNYLATDSNLDKETILKYLKQGYLLQDILHSAKLAEQTNKSLETILPLRTVTCDWQQVEQKLGLAVSKNEQPQVAFGRGQRSGAGFAGLHTRDMTKERAVRIFHEDYLFDEAELGALYDAFGFQKTEDICLHAYMSRKSLADIVKLCDKYSWERMKYVIGLTPQVYFNRCVDYQARRLQERMDIPQKTTKKYMHMGYAMHHINTAYLLAKKAGLDISQVIDLKTPKNSWNDVAEKIGLTKADCLQIKNKISHDFGRHA